MIRRRHVTAPESHPARAVARALTIACSALLLALALPRGVQAQDDVEESPIVGLFSAGYLPSFQDTDLAGESLADGQGFELEAGFATGDTFAWLLGYQLSMRSNYNTHFIPATMRVYSPDLLDRLRFYGQASIGLFFSQVSGKFGAAENERASAWRLGGGVEIDLIDRLSGYVDGGWTNGLGSANSFKYGTVGVGVVYRWDI